MALQLQISYCFPEYLTDGATISRLLASDALGGSLGEKWLQTRTPGQRQLAANGMRNW
jgi:hypothetical protein